MDERLERALAFSNYSVTVNNQKENLKNRLHQVQIVHHSGGVFKADHETIGFVKTLLDLEHTECMILDSKENTIPVRSLSELLEKLVAAYMAGVQEYDAEMQKLKRSRSIAKIMDM